MNWFLLGFALDLVFAYWAFTSPHMGLFWRIIWIGSFGTAIGNIIDVFLSAVIGTDSVLAKFLLTIIFAFCAVARHNHFRNTVNCHAQRKEEKRQKHEPGV